MAHPLQIDHKHRPSPGFPASGPFPPITATWKRHRVAARDLADFLALSGLPEQETLPLLYPHTMSFPLQMVVLTHPLFPVPVWRVLQVRNRMLQHRPLERGAVLDISTRLAAHRILDKGAEVDLHTTVTADGSLAWESMNTFYMRGRFPVPQAAPDEAASPVVREDRVEEWRMPTGGGLRFAALTGDYNGLHLADWYAHRQGFRHAFFHPQRVLGHCLARLGTAVPAGVHRFDAWLKGPVFYAAPVQLRSQSEERQAQFALHVADDARPAILGRSAPAAAGSRLVETSHHEPRAGIPAGNPREGAQA